MSHVDREGKTTLQIKARGGALSIFATRPLTADAYLPYLCSKVVSARVVFCWNFVAKQWWFIAPVNTQTSRVCRDAGQTTDYPFLSS
jgi:hypothetical protein